MNLLKKIFLLPSFPLIILFGIWIIYKIMKNTNEVELEIAIEKDENLLTDEIKAEISEMFKPHVPLLYFFSLGVWILLIQYLFF